MITQGMWDKAQRLIARDARRAHKAANTRRNGKSYKGHRRYSLPARAAALVAALGAGDAAQVSAIMFNQYNAAA